MNTTDELIHRLSTETRPVRPLRPPTVRALIWLAVATLIVGGIVASRGLRPDLASEIERPLVIIEWLASVITGVLAAIATFHVSIPGRSMRWALLPLPGLMLWVMSLSLGCIADWITLDSSDVEIGFSPGCFQSIVMTSIPLGLTLLVMVRHAGPVRPGLTTVLGALSIAALSAAGLSLFHHLNSSLLVLISHGSGVAFVMLVSWACSGTLFRWIGLKMH